MRVVLSQEDITAAENFLAEYLTEAVPEASFQPGSAMRDLTVQAFAHIFAFLRGEVNHVAAMQSLQKIVADESTAVGLDSSDMSQMVDEILSNWFISRNGGLYARLTAQLHFTQRATVSIRSDTRFWRTSNTAFYIDTPNNVYVVTSDSMRPVYDTRGRLIDYIADVPLKAARTGDAYNVTAGKFLKVESSAGIPYLSYVDHTDGSKDGASTETTADFIARAQTAITVRNLVNNRSIDTVLQDQFPDILSTLTIGMGEPEMLRDKRTEVAAHIELHIGGHYDTYVELKEGSYEENGTVGFIYPRPDGKAMVFRDLELTVDNGNTFTSLGVQPGHVLYIRSGILGSPRGYQVKTVLDHELYVSEATPFTQASDEIDGGEVTYSIGWLSPSFVEIDFGGATFIRTAAQSVNPNYSAITAGTSRRMSSPGYVFLSGRPVLDVTSVEITNPATGDALKDPSTGTIRFPNRTNMPPVIGSVIGTSEYQVVVLNPEKSQSAEAVVAVNVGYFDNPTVFDGKNLRVRYKTLPAFPAIHAYARNISDRVLAANHLIRSRHPVWIGAEIPVRYKATVTPTASFDAIKQGIADYINAFNMNDYLDMSDLMTVLRNGYDQIGTVFPFPITYDLHLPDGQVIAFSTDDIVSIRMTDTNGVSIVHPEDIIVPQELINRGITSISTGSDLDELYALVGISDRTVTYKSRADLIGISLKG
jgi:hypothetical protein